MKISNSEISFEDNSEDCKIHISFICGKAYKVHSGKIYGEIYCSLIYAASEKTHAGNLYIKSP